MADESETTIRIRDNGPLVVEGSVTITDADGNAFATNPDKPVVALCRCGASKNKPFCDGAHNGIDFKAAERAG